MIPKDPPRIDRALIARLAATVSQCEWPPGCHEAVGLQTAHIRARGMGGARRKDTEENLVRLCRKHHHIYDHEMGQSPKNQEWMREGVLKRPQWMRDMIRGNDETTPDRDPVPFPGCHDCEREPDIPI